MTKHDQSVDAFERFFGKAEFVTIKKAAEFFSCSIITIKRRFAKFILSCPGGLRIPRAAIINAIE